MKVRDFKIDHYYVNYDDDGNIKFVVKALKWYNEVGHGALLQVNFLLAKAESKPDRLF